jgi:pimeloyl-ACP methyl ester carboxylesterase
MKNFILFLIVLCCNSAFASRPLKLLNQAYGPHERNVFDIISPRVFKKVPLVVFIHGGGWVQGDKSEIYDHLPLIKKYLKSGIAFATINYRFLKHAPLQTIMREDIGGFIQYIRAYHRRFNIDPEKIMVFGTSAGGSAALWLATHDDLANRRSSNIVKNQSTRILAAGHVNAQVSYDFHEWFHFFGEDVTLNFLTTDVWRRYHFNSLSDLYTPEGEEVRKSLNSFANYSRDDAEVLFYNSYASGPSKTRDHFLHAPRHAEILFERSIMVGARASLYLDPGVVKQYSPFELIHEFFVERLRSTKIK